MEEFNQELWEQLWEINKIEDQYATGEQRILVTRDQYTLITANILNIKKMPLHITIEQFNLEEIEQIARISTRLLINLDQSILKVKINHLENKKVAKWAFRFFSTLENMELSERTSIIPQNYRVFNSHYCTEKFNLEEIRINKEIEIIFS